jgi:hypothetical protein
VDTQKVYIADDTQIAGRRGDRLPDGDRVRCGICFFIFKSGKADHLAASFGTSEQSVK